MEKESSKLIDSFLESAKKYGAYLFSADSKGANKEHAVMTKLMKSINGQGYQDDLLLKLGDPDPYVRLCIASFCIRHAPAECLATLEKISGTSGAVSISAAVILDLWNSGRL